MKLLSAAFVGGIVLLGSVFLPAFFSGQIYAQSDSIQTNVPALKDVYAHDFRIGCLLSYRNIGFSTDPYVPGQSTVVTPFGGYLIKFHMNNMSPGNNMKPMYTVNITGSAAAYAAATSDAARDSIDTHPIVRFNGDLIAQLNWAQRQGFTFRGHTLVWHSQTPAEFFLSGYTSTGARLTRDMMTARLENYIKEVVRLIHEGWPGLLVAIDVVNEAVTDAGGDRTDSPWYITFGDNSYIMKAFEFTRKYTVQYGENQIRLYYNDYNTSTASKASKIAQVCSPIFRAGYLDGIGMQEHDNNSSPTAAAWIASYNKFDTVCTEMSVTELDVATGSTTPTAAQLVTQANQYGQLFKCFVERSYFSGRGKLISVSKDGLNDAYTFVNQATSLWDAHNKCKPAFFAVVGVGLHYNALDSLIAYGDSLNQSLFTPDSWAAFAPVLASAKYARDKNYSNTVSADTTLGMAEDSLQAAINALVVTGVAESGTMAKAFALEQNYPNPFNPTTVVGSQLSVVSNVKLVVYDVLGREVKVLVNERRAPGVYHDSFDGSGLASGIYIYRMTAGAFVQSRTMILMK